MYVENRLPHAYIKTTPYQALTEKQPNITNLCTFGSTIHAKKPDKKKAKFDHNTSNSIFFGYTATTKNIYFIDNAMGNVKIVVHALFDEAYFTAPSAQTPQPAQTL